jgi:hypothetical protein
VTNTQLATLRWLAEVGGVGLAYGEKIVSPAHYEWKKTWKKHRGEGLLTGADAYQMPAISALHLVQAGCIEARGGQLHITDKGRRHLEPFRKVAA